MYIPLIKCSFNFLGAILFSYNLTFSWAASFIIILSSSYLDRVSPIALIRFYNSVLRWEPDDILWYKLFNGICRFTPI